VVRDLLEADDQSASHNGAMSDADATHTRGGDAALSCLAPRASAPDDDVGQALLTERKGGGKSPCHECCRWCKTPQVTSRRCRSARFPSSLR